MKKTILSALVAMTVSLLSMAQLPLINHIYADDPSGHVWSDNPIFKPVMK